MDLLSNKKKQDEKLSKERNKRCEPVAAEIFHIIVRHNPSMRDRAKDWESVLNDFGPIMQEINALFKLNNFTISECNYTWTIVQQIIDGIKNLSNEAIQRAFEFADHKMWGVDNTVNDVTLHKIDEMLELLQKKSQK